MVHEGRKGREGNNLSEVLGQQIEGMHQHQCPPLRSGLGSGSQEIASFEDAALPCPLFVCFFHHAGDRGACSSLGCARVATLRSIRQAGHVSQARSGLRATSQRQLQPAELPDVPLSSSA